MNLQKVLLISVSIIVSQVIWSQDCLLNRDYSIYTLNNRDYNFDAIVKTPDDKSLVLFGYKTFYNSSERSIFNSYSKPAIGIHNLNDCNLKTHVPYKTLGNYKHSKFADDGQLALFSWNTLAIVNIGKLATYQNYGLKNTKISLVGAGRFKSNFYALTTSGKGETALNIVKHEDGSLLKEYNFSKDYSLYYGYLTSDGLMYCFFNENFEKILLRTYQVGFDGSNVTISEIASKSYDDDLFDISLSDHFELNFDKNQQLYIHFIEKSEDQHQFKQMIFSKDGSYRKGLANKTINKYNSKYQVLYTDDDGYHYICLKDNLDEVKVLKINPLTGKSAVKSYTLNLSSKIKKGEKDAIISRCIGIVKVEDKHLIVMGVTNITTEKEQVVYKKLSQL